MFFFFFFPFPISFFSTFPQFDSFYRMSNADANQAFEMG